MRTVTAERQKLKEWAVYFAAGNITERDISRILTVPKTTVHDWLKGAIIPDQCRFIVNQNGFLLDNSGDWSVYVGDVTRHPQGRKRLEKVKRRKQTSGQGHA